MDAAPAYDPRYLAGVLCFNDHDYFEAHEVWEDLWAETAGLDRRFVQGLIQAAVGLLHFGNGNLRGAVKLYHSSRDYMTRVPSPHWGLDHAAFWQQMALCFAEVLSASADARVELHLELVPSILLDPAPASWPDRNDFVESDEA